MFFLSHTSCSVPPKPLVLGYECARVFPVGTGSVEHDVSQERASHELQFGALRKVVARERQETLSWRAW